MITNFCRWFKYVVEFTPYMETHSIFYGKNEFIVQFYFGRFLYFYVYNDWNRHKPRSHALIYTRYVNYTYMYNLHPDVKIYLLRVHMYLKSIGLTVHKSFSLRRQLILSETEVWTHVFHAFWTKEILFRYCTVILGCICSLLQLNINIFVKTMCVKLDFKCCVCP